LSSSNNIEIMSLEEIKLKAREILDRGDQRISYKKKYYQSESSGYLVDMTDEYGIITINTTSQRYGIILFESLLSIHGFGENPSEVKTCRERYEEKKDTLDYLDLEIEKEKMVLNMYNIAEPLRKKAKENEMELLKKQKKLNNMILNRELISYLLNTISDKLDYIENPEDRELIKSLLSEIETLLPKPNVTAKS